MSHSSLSSSSSSVELTVQYLLGEIAQRDQLIQNLQYQLQVSIQYLQVLTTIAPTTASSLPEVSTCSETQASSTNTVKENATPSSISKSKLVERPPDSINPKGQKARPKRSRQTPLKLGVKKLKIESNNNIIAPTQEDQKELLAEEDERSQIMPIRLLPRYWTTEEHSKFLEGLDLYGSKGKAIKEIALHVGTRSRIQVRTHLQKYFLRLNREGIDIKGRTHVKVNMSMGVPLIQTYPDTAAVTT